MVDPTSDLSQPPVMSCKCLLPAANAADVSIGISWRQTARRQINRQEPRHLDKVNRDPPLDSNIIRTVVRIAREGTCSLRLPLITRTQENNKDLPSNLSMWDSNQAMSGSTSNEPFPTFQLTSLTSPFVISDLAEWRVTRGTCSRLAANNRGNWRQLILEVMACSAKELSLRLFPLARSRIKSNELSIVILINRYFLTRYRTLPTVTIAIPSDLQFSAFYTSLDVLIFVDNRN